MRRVIRDCGFPVNGYAAGWLDAYRERWDYLLKVPGDKTASEADEYTSACTRS